ncbi:MAG: ParM/StbA family protein [Eubacteriales bacterium]|nr:ParM/StbA family protein [Eubacteriales bacterium]
MSSTKDYRAQTITIRRDNGKLSKTWLIAADIGYSAVKIMSHEVVASFPSYASRLGEDRGSFGTIPDSHIVYTDTATGEKWLVGQAAQDRISDRDTSVTEKALYGRERYDDPAFRVIVETGLALGMPAAGKGTAGDKEIVIQTGFPPEYQSDEEDLCAVFSGLHDFSIKIGEHEEVHYRFQILPKNVYTMPQPKGTLFSAVVDRNGVLIPSMKDCLMKNIMVFDGGFGTLDLFPICAGHLEECQTNDQLGMRRVLKETTMMLKKEYGIDISVPALHKYLTTGKARYHKKNVSKDIEFGDLLEEASKKVCKEALQWMSQVYELYEYEYLIITGGTGAAWEGTIREELSEMSTLKIINGNSTDSLGFVFANVRGYFLSRLITIRGEEKKS